MSRQFVILCFVCSTIIGLLRMNLTPWCPHCTRQLCLWLVAFGVHGLLKRSQFLLFCVSCVNGILPFTRRNARNGVSVDRVMSYPL